MRIITSIQAKRASHLVFLLNLFLLLLLTSFSASAHLPSKIQTDLNIEETQDWSTSWSMAGANPQRTSWTGEEVRGRLKPIWYRPIEPYISQKVQIIAANNLLYIATVRGLYALNAGSGATEWVYPTELPLGHSPTIFNNVAYVGGFDHKIHAINALTGEGIWTFEADAGFHTNPLIEEGKLFAGNRDGYFYAINIQGPNVGKLAWKYKTNGPILFSAAYQEGAIFFASNDSHAYALAASSGNLIWKSSKLPGAGFTSYWPVIYQDRVIFSGSNNYRFITNPGPGRLAAIERDDIYGSDPRGTPLGAVGTGPGDWTAGSPTIDATAALQYFTSKPWRKTTIALNRFNGQEEETVPLLWTGNAGSAARYPPVIGADGVLYQQNSYMADPYIPGGQVAGWQPGNKYISIVSSDWGAVDEPHAAAAGGSLVYWNLCCDRQAGAFDVTLPNTGVLDRWNSGGKITGAYDNNREWNYFSYNLEEKIPGYNVRYFSPHNDFTFPYSAFRGLAGSTNGYYGFHGDVNPPIPYQGKVYMHRSNAIIAFADSSEPAVPLPEAEIVNAPNAEVTPHTDDELRQMLENEAHKILEAGHLRPGYGSHGIFDLHGKNSCGDELVDYWHSPAETIVTLINALPYLSPVTQQEVKYYIQAEFNNYPPYDFNHVGWRGTAREPFILPPEVATAVSSSGPREQNYTFKDSGGWNNEGVWGRNPFGFYALWKYAETYGGAANIYQESKNDLSTVAQLPTNQLLLNMPHILNAYIAGYIGFLELESLAGQPESTFIKNELNRLINLRVNNFSTDSAYAELISYCRTLNAANNFMYLVPELAEKLRTDALNKVTAAIAEYDQMSPYWFVSFAEEGYAENPKSTLYDAHGMFMAHSLILQTDKDQLAKYLDVPSFAVGDLFFIDKLVLLLGKPGYGFTLNLNPLPTMLAGETHIELIGIKHVGGFTGTVSLETSSANPQLSSNFNVSQIDEPGGVVQLTLIDTHPSPLMPGQWFPIEIIASSGSIIQSGSIQLLVGGSRNYLPIVSKN